MNKQTVSKILIVFTLIVTFLTLKCYSLGKSVDLLQNKTDSQQHLYEYFAQENFTNKIVKQKFINFKTNVVNMICKNSSSTEDKEKDLKERQTNFMNLNTTDKTSELYIDPTTHTKGKAFLQNIFDNNILKGGIKGKITKEEWCRNKYSEMNSQIEGFISFDKLGNPITQSGRPIRQRNTEPLKLTTGPGGRVYGPNRELIGIIKDDGTLVGPDGSVICRRRPDGVIVGLDGSVIGSVGAIGSTLNTDGSMVNNDGSVINPDGSITRPDGTVIRPDGTVIGNNGQIIGRLHRDGFVRRPDGTIVRFDGTVIGRPGPNGTIIGPDGRVIGRPVPNGTIIGPGGVVGRPYLNAGLTDLLNRIFPAPSTNENFEDARPSLGTRPSSGARPS